MPDGAGSTSSQSFAVVRNCLEKEELVCDDIVLGPPTWTSLNGQAHVPSNTELAPASKIPMNPIPELWANVVVQRREGGGTTGRAFWPFQKNRK